MSLSLPIALILQRNNIKCFAMGPMANGKYGGVGYLMDGDVVVKPVISIQTGEFDTCKEAIDVLNQVIEDVRELDLSTQEDKLDKML